MDSMQIRAQKFMRSLKNKASNNTTNLRLIPISRCLPGGFLEFHTVMKNFDSKQIGFIIKKVYCENPTKSN